jgi:hypothetical protein
MREKNGECRDVGGRLKSSGSKARDLQARENKKIVCSSALRYHDTAKVDDFESKELTSNHQSSASAFASAAQLLLARMRLLSGC